MLLFQRIFDFQFGKVAQIENRLSRRFSPGRNFPLWAALDYGRELPAKVHNISATGVALLVRPEHAPAAGATGKLVLTLGPHRLDLDVRVAHAQPHEESVLCGLAVEFGDFSERKGYLQLLQPIAIGSSLEEVDPKLVEQNEPQFTKAVFRGEFDSVLSVWRESAAGGAIRNFELTMHEYLVRGDVHVRVLEVFHRAQMERPPQMKVSAPVFDLSGGVNDEVRQLFSWVLPNLPPGIPEDVRGFLKQFATS